MSIIYFIFVTLRDKLIIFIKISVDKIVDNLNPFDFLVIFFRKKNF